MRVENLFTLTVENASGNNVGLNAFSLKVKHLIFDLFDLSHFLASLAFQVVGLREGMMKEL